MLDPAGTATVANGSPAAAVGVIGAACGLLPPPGNIVCGTGAVVYGSATAQVAKDAHAAGLCPGFYGNQIGGVPTPTTAIC